MTQPYPNSSAITSVSYDVNGDAITVEHQGSDLWYMFHGADGNVYSLWGDGQGVGDNGGFGAGRVKWGLARFEGSMPPTITPAANVFGGIDAENTQDLNVGKVFAVEISGTMYGWMNKQLGQHEFQLVKSTDTGANWSNVASTTFDADTFAFHWWVKYDSNYAKNDQPEPGDYVYMGGGPWGVSTGIYLGRVLRNQIENTDAYEYFVNMNSQTYEATWSSNIADRQPVYEDPNNNCFNNALIAEIQWSAGLNRYLLTTSQDRIQDLIIADAPKPWGPWTIVDYIPSWFTSNVDAGEALNYSFVDKWMSGDGTKAWLTYSGVSDSGSALDSLNIVELTFTKGTSNLTASTVGLSIDTPISSIVGSGSASISSNPTGLTVTTPTGFINTNIKMSRVGLDLSLPTSILSGSGSASVVPSVVGLLLGIPSLSLEQIFSEVYGMVLTNIADVIEFTTITDNTEFREFE